MIIFSLLLTSFLMGCTGGDKPTNEDVDYALVNAESFFYSTFNKKSCFEQAKWKEINYYTQENPFSKGLMHIIVVECKYNNPSITFEKKGNAWSFITHSNIPGQ